MFGLGKTKTCPLDGDLSRCREENAKAANDLLSEIDALLSVKTAGPPPSANLVAMKGRRQRH